MLGISTQRHQFCRFIWCRETRGSEYSIHCLFVYHTPCATDIDNAALSQNTEEKQGWWHDSERNMDFAEALICLQVPRLRVPDGKYAGHGARQARLPL